MIDLLEDLQMCVTSELAAATDNCGALHRALGGILARFPVPPMIDALLKNERWLSAVARDSYEHTNGFDKLVLVSQQTGGKLRLHVWWGGDRTIQIEEHIHNHRWNFATKILVGHYRYEIYQPSLGPGMRYYRHRYEPVSDDGAFQLTSEGRDGLELVNTGIVSSMSGYALHSSVLHRVSQESRSMVLSIVLHGNAVRESTSVYSGSDLGGTVTRVKRFSVVDLRERLARIRSEYPAT